MEDQGETFERTTHPDYSSGGLHKELADMLFILHDECMVVSIKGTDDQPKPAERLRNWLRKKTWQASKGGKAGIQRLATVTFSARNLWGETREFPAGSLKPQCGIALLECSQEPFKSIEFDVEQPACQVPIHFLSLNDILNAVMWLGSVWDVFQYFRQRANVFSTITGINQEQPALSYYTLRAKDFKGFPEAANNELKELHNLLLLDNLENYQERERPAGYVNAVVHELHTRFPEMESLTPPELRSFVEPRDKRSAYLKMAAMLNELPMSNKANIGRRLETMLKDLKRSGQQGCFAFKRLYGQMVYVFACFSGMSRTERMRALNQLLPAGLYRYKVSEGLGIAIDADDEKSGFDVEWIGGSRYLVRILDSLPLSFSPNPRPQSPIHSERPARILHRNQLMIKSNASTACPKSTSNTSSTLPSRRIKE